MPYQAVLDGLVRAVPGVQAALLLDGEGEVVVEAGTRNDRMRLIGAYQGIALAAARRTSARYAGGLVTYMVCTYAWGHVIVRPLRDGYYLVLSLSPDGAVGVAVHRSALAGERLDEEL